MSCSSRRRVYDLPRKCCRCRRAVSLSVRGDMPVIRRNEFRGKSSDYLLHLIEVTKKAIAHHTEEYERCIKELPFADHPYEANIFYDMDKARIAKARLSTLRALRQRKEKS